MSAQTRLCLGLLATLTLTACSSAPTHFYTLMSPADAREGQRSVTPPGFQLDVGVVRVPVQVDQPQLVVREAGGGLAILETERWSSPLADEFHDTLVDRLESELGVRDLAGLPKSASVPVLGVQTEVRRFDSWPGQYALIDVVWSLSLRQNGQPPRTLTCSSTLRQPAGQSVQQVVLAHRETIAALAATIASTARRWSQNTNVQCPQ